MDSPSRFKFRAWDGAQMRPCRIVGDPPAHAEIFELGDKIPRYVDLDCVMQSTGLLDKNGVEIFEGDLFRYTNERGESSVLEVVWFEHGWYGALPECKDDREYDYEIPLWNIPKEYEVIGNIYQRPDSA